MSGSVTAKVVVTGHAPYMRGEEVEQVAVSFQPDYSDGRNAEWARWTPALSLQITVKAELVSRFPIGQPFLLTFTPEGVPLGSSGAVPEA